MWFPQVEKDHSNKVVQVEPHTRDLLVRHLNGPDLNLAIIILILFPIIVR